MGRPRKQTVSSESQFTISLKMGNEVYKSQGATAFEALATLPIPDKIFLKGILTCERNGKKHELLLLPPRIKRLFYPLARQMVAKQLSYGL